MSTSAFEAALERDGEWSGELTHTTRDGRRIIVESRHVLMREADGRRFVLETNRDITERKRAEHALEELAGQAHSRSGRGTQPHRAGAAQSHQPDARCPDHYDRSTAC